MLDCRYNLLELIFDLLESVALVIDFRRKSDGLICLILFKSKENVGNIP